ncbi:hypothetical protein D3C81_722100 [compost metagenome]
MGDQRGQIICCVCRCLGTRSENTRNGGKCLVIKPPGRRIWRKWLLGLERSHQPKSKNVDGVFDERPDLISVLVVSTSIIRNPELPQSNQRGYRHPFGDRPADHQELGWRVEFSQPSVGRIRCLTSRGAGGVRGVEAADESDIRMVADGRPHKHVQ